MTLMLTETRGLSIGVASLVLTASALVWAVGSWWQSRVIARIGARRLTALGAMLIAVGAPVVMVGLLEVPVVVPYVGWRSGASALHRLPDDPAGGDGRGQEDGRPGSPPGRS